MADPQNPPPPSSTKVASEISNGGAKSVSGFPGQKPRFPNPPDSAIPDPSTLRDQWRFAVRQYSRWYSQAWGGAILAGVTFFALGWVIKGGNPLPSLQGDSPAPPSSDEPKEAPK